MAVTCGSCGTTDDNDSAYCLNPSCGALLAPVARDDPPAPDGERSATPVTSAPATTTPVNSTTPTRSATPATTSTPTRTTSAPSRSPVWSCLGSVAAIIRRRQGRHRHRDPAPPVTPDPAPPVAPERLPDGARTRWLPAAVALALVAAIGVAVTLSLPDGDSNAQDRPPVRAVVAPLPGPEPSASAIAPSASPTPSRIATTGPTVGDALARPKPAQTTATKVSPSKTSAPAASLTVSTGGSHCTGWPEGHGWTIAVAVTVYNGSGTSASGSHGYDSNVGGGGTYSLSGGGTSFSGELPPNQGGNPELSDPSVTWSVTVQLASGGSLTRSGTAYRPSSC